MKNIFYYLPRILSILITLFFGVFILEGFSPGFGLQDALSHLLQTFVVLGITIVAWKWQKIGGCLFVLLGVFFSMFFHPFWWNGLAFGGFFLLIGVLFLLPQSSRK
jgi:hypothetical protein